MKLAISQSNYIPWKGYFDLIASVDRFVLYDTVQFTKNDWRNRNLIKTQCGVQWLSIPVGASIHRTIQEVALPQTSWRIKHWKSLVAAYARTPFFVDVASWLEPIYLQKSDLTLSDFNARLIRAVCHYLGIRTEIVFDDGRCRQQDRVLKLVELCHRHGADTYVSAPAGKNYIEAGIFQAHDVRLEWFDYPDYPTYAQLHGPFVHRVSVLDALFHCGPHPESIFASSGQHRLYPCQELV
ncbi:WbqC family protein [Aquabacterium sp.]|uniref:WbqC family protein n=1 Tax=Aquabacterium sp. TaxID=1872578 RepID=UPI0027BA0A94|nr:WbqC family protein [Aquabacterium sp.]